MMNRWRRSLKLLKKTTKTSTATIISNTNINIKVYLHLIVKIVITFFRSVFIRMIRISSLLLLKPSGTLLCSIGRCWWWPERWRIFRWSSRPIVWFSFDKSEFKICSNFWQNLGVLLIICSLKLCILVGLLHFY